MGVTKQYDVVIVGGGLVGICLVTALAQLPLRIALIEINSLRKESTAVNDSPGAALADSRPLALTYTSWQLLVQLGLWPLLEPYATPIKRVHISEQGQWGMARIDAGEQRVSVLGYVVPAAILGQELTQQLLALSERQAENFTLFNPAHVVNVSPNAEGYSLELNTVAGPQTVSAKLVLAADGSNSTIRQLLNLTTERFDYQQTALASVITLTRSHHFIAYERFTRLGTIALLPMAGQRCGCIWTVTQMQAAQLLASSPEDYLQQVQTEFGYRLGKFIAVSARQAYPLQQVHANQSAQPGILLLGNAAHTVHPVAAQGFNLGLQDVALLLKILRETLDKGYSLAGGELSAAYQQARQRDEVWTLKFTHRLVSWFTPDFLPLKLARNAGLLLFDAIPPFKRRIVNRLLGRAGGVSSF